MRDLEAQAIRAENRSCQDFLLTHQTLLHQAPNSVKEDIFFLFSFIGVIFTMSAMHVI